MVSLVSTPAVCEVFRWFGDLPGGAVISKAEDVSADGLTVVGHSESAAGRQAFRWTLAEGMTDFGWAEPSSKAYAVSADGLTAVGTRTVPVDRPAATIFKVGHPGPIGVGSLGNWSSAYDVSADGSVVVGSYAWVPSSPPNYFGFRSGTKLTGITYQWEAHAYAVSADGQTVVGESWTGSEPDYWYEATKWEGDWSAGTMIGQGLGRLGGSDSAAHAISSDGSTIVGRAGEEAARFVPNGMSLGHLPGHYQSGALAVSGDGSIVGGWSGSSEAFIWDEDSGMRSLKDVLETEYGVDLSGWTLTSVEGISDDGTVLAGNGTRGGGMEAWVAVIPEPSTLLLLGMGALGITIGWWRRRKA